MFWREPLSPASSSTAVPPAVATATLLQPEEGQRWGRTNTTDLARDDGDCTGGPRPTALDLSCGRLAAFLGGAPPARQAFGCLRVLLVAGAPLETRGLAAVLAACPLLERLDASRCKLAALPSEAMWASMAHLAVLFVHHNALKHWQDIAASVCAPVLQWLTCFGNPATCRVHARAQLVRQRPSLLAIDFAMVTDDERLGVAPGGRPEGRFTSAAISAAVAAAVGGAEVDLEERSEQDLLAEATEHLRKLHWEASHCSASIRIQSYWRGSRARRTEAVTKARILRAVISVQRHARRHLWRREMQAYTKQFLQERQELDLLLNAKEMYQLEASKKVAQALKHWIVRRRRMKAFRRSAELLTRWLRGVLVRRRKFHDLHQLGRDTRVFFPERGAWGFLMLLNGVLRRRGLPTYPEDHHFQVAEVVGVRVPDPDEVEPRQSSIYTLLSYEKSLVLRPARRGRFPEHPWDGPVHRFTSGPSRHRTNHFSKEHRQAFLSACCPAGQHPLLADAPADTKWVEDVRLREQLKRPEENWPKVCRDPGAPAALFMSEAKRCTGLAWPKWKRGSGVHTDPDTGQRRYSGALWLSQKLLFHDLGDENLALSLLPAILRYNKCAEELRFLRPIAFFTGKALVPICATAVIQASFRAHLDRSRARLRLPALPSLVRPSTLGHTQGVASQGVTRFAPAQRESRASVAGGPCFASWGVLPALARLRAAVCVQRGWRWSLLRRRTQLLTGAYEYVRGIRTPNLYIEERLFMSLSLIANADRYVPLIPERALGFGRSNEALVLVRPSLAGASSRMRRGTLGGSATSSHNLAVEQEEHPLVRHKRLLGRRLGGLPAWLLEESGELPEVGPDDPALQAVNGLQGLIEQFGPPPDAGEETIKVVEMPSLQILAKQSSAWKSGYAGEVPPEALAASGGTFRYIEIKFPSLAQAKLYGLAVFMCTFTAPLRFAVPIVNRSSLHSSDACRQILLLWQHFGLCWPIGDRVAPQRARQWNAQSAQSISCCGKVQMRLLERPDKWAELLVQEGREQEEQEEEKKKHSSAGWLESRRQANLESTLRKYDHLITEFKQRKRDQHAALEEQVRDLDRTQLQRMLQGPTKLAAAGDVYICGALPPTSASRTGDSQAVISCLKADKAAAGTLRQQVLEADAEARQRSHDEVVAQRGRGREGREFEDRLADFYERCEREERAKTMEDEVQRRQEALELRQRVLREKVVKTLPPRPGAKEAVMALNTRDFKEELDRERRVMAREMEEARALEEVKARAEERKAKRAASSEVAKVLHAFASRRTGLERLARAEDAARVREVVQAVAQAGVASKREKWEAQTRALHQRHMDILQYRQREVADLRARLLELIEARRQADEEDLAKARMSIVDRKALDRLLRAARAQLAHCEQLAEAGPGKGKPGEGGEQAPEGLDEERADEYEAAVASVLTIAGQVSDVLQGSGDAATPRRRRSSSTAPAVGAAHGGKAEAPAPAPRAPSWPPQPPPPPPAGALSARGTPPVPLQATLPTPRQALVTPRQPPQPRAQSLGGSRRTGLPDAADPWLRKLGAAHLAVR